MSVWCRLRLKHGRRLHRVLRGLGRSGRQPQLKARSFVNLAVDGNRAAVLLDNLLHNAQPQAGAVSARGKERVKDMRKVGCGDALSRVPDSYDQYR